MRTGRVLASAMAAGTLAISLAVPAQAAVSAAKPKGSLTVYTHQTQMNVLDLGASGVTVGDVTTGSGTVATSVGGKSVGTFAYRSENVSVSIPGGNRNVLSTTAYVLPTGQILTQGLISAPGGTAPVATQTRVILGGTGKYAGASGTAVMNPGANQTDWTITFRFVS